MPIPAAMALQRAQLRIRGAREGEGPKAAIAGVLFPSMAIAAQGTTACHPIGPWSK